MGYWFSKSTKLIDLDLTGRWDTQDVLIKKTFYKTKINKW